jgi:Tol biopolymer transport system component
MLRGSLLAAALVPLLGFGSGAGHVRNGRIAYVHLGDNGDRFQIYTITASGAHRHPLTTSRKYSSYAPAFAPRGKRIVFVRAYRQSDLWLMNADGRQKRDLTSTAHVDEIDPAWSPDGQEIAFAVESPSALDGIWVVGAAGQGSRQLTNGDDTHPSWSPDGNTIAFQRYDSATQIDAILTVPAGGGTTTTLSADPGASDLDPAWSPNGDEILFSSDRPNAVQLDLWVMSPTGTDFSRVTNTPNRDEGGAAWSPDGRRIVYGGNGAFHGASSSQIYVSMANGTQRHILTHACGECAWVNEEPSWQPLP